MAEKKEERWFEQNGKGPGYPRLWLVTGEKNLLLSWAMISQIEASDDFLSIRFLCEYGIVLLASSESLQRLFECMQTETVRRIDGRLLACKITPLE